ncbi:AraC family transcriptional regulator [Flavobacterium sp. DG2-3]|uniref:helix-turn-helix domain-containing protein n=1 Tax=Flavobacterium sp. DG2-3 TaxID=3068317 RepID=UPI00273F6F0B|nr:AraC family transcriptional regulator [Flavobacterium sp. DG2-3]MDP5199134.1 AraC family transcriptional regulator [Flavobacterium sp. DG2-3]
MKEIKHHYGVELDWVESYAEQLEGHVEGNFIVTPDHISTGVRYFLNCDFGISAFYKEFTANTKLHFTQENKLDDFVGIYYNLTEVGQTTSVFDNVYNSIGKWNYNLSFIDSSLTHNYIVDKDTKVFTLCIFIKKEIIKVYLERNPTLKDHVDQIVDPKQNTILKITRMSNESIHLLNELRSREVGGVTFDFHLRGAVQCLLAEYVQSMSFDDLVIDKVNNDDFLGIVKSQAFLMDNLNRSFPSITTLARDVNMSGSKYKTLFKKVTGLTPNSFFLNNKLQEAKRLLMETHLTIAQVSDELSFTSHSYFTAKFKDFYGMSPKDFIKQIT